MRRLFIPWEATQDADQCDDWAVVEKRTGDVVACHESEQKAREQVKALYSGASDKAASQYSQRDQARLRR